LNLWHVELRVFGSFWAAVNIAINFRKNKQLDLSISKIYFCYKTLYVSGIFCAHHQGLSTVNPAIGTLHAGYVTAS